MNVYIVVDENQTINVVCSSEFAAMAYIKANERFEGELNYIGAEIWTLADVDKVYYKDKKKSKGKKILLKEIA